MNITELITNKLKRTNQSGESAIVIIVFIIFCSLMVLFHVVDLSRTNEKFNRIIKENIHNKKLMSTVDQARETGFSLGHKRKIIEDFNTGKFR